MYDPTVGRWLSQDPIGFKGGDPNLYRYVGNSPTNATDPSGLVETSVFDIPVAAGAGLVQGGANLVNGLQDTVIGLGNLVIGIPNATASGVYWLNGTDATQQMKIPYIHSPDWSKGLVVDESDTCHGISKFSGAAGVEILSGAWIAKASKAKAAAAILAEGAGTATAGSAGAATLAEIAPALADNAMVNLGSIARSMVSPPGGRSYWFRFGDVKHLTPQQVRTVIGDLASAGTEQGCKVIRVAKEPTKLVPRPPSNAANIAEYISDEGVEIIQSINLLK